MRVHGTRLDAVKALLHVRPQGRVLLRALVDEVDDVFWAVPRNLQRADETPLLR